MNHTTPLPARLAALVLALGGLAASGFASDDKPGVPLPEADYDKLVDRALKTLEQGLQGLASGEKKYGPRFQRQARAAAVMIAAYAQNGPASRDAQQRAALRDAALQVAATIKAEKYAEARKQAAVLKGAKLEGKVDQLPMPLMPKYLDLLEAMQQFSSLPGGLALERERILSVLSDKEVRKLKALPEKYLTEDYALAAWQMAVIAELIKDHPPPKAKGAGLKEWQGFTADMRQAATDLASQIQKKDGKAALAALQKLNASCRGCHEPFRPME
jgi:cytochrome c556